MIYLLITIIFSFKRLKQKKKSKLSFFLLGYTATISDGFYPSHMDQNNLVPARNRVEYPTLFTTSDLTSTGIFKLFVMKERFIPSHPEKVDSS